ncbi:type IV secretion system DNA-binding domain-containing protein [Cereibacter sp. SYSU M97828]|nr:type IV secretion system DNA-binding domain-containing protein [Cereibacter flavus]
MSVAKRNQPTRFVRGGQTTQHWWRMAAQVLRTSLFMALGAFTLTYCVLIAANYEIRHIRETFAIFLADYNVAMDNAEKPLTYTDFQNRRLTRTAGQIAADTRLRTVAEEYSANASLFAWYAAVPAMLAFLMGSAVFVYAGRNLGENEHVRGSKLISQPELSKWSQKKWKTYRKRFGRDTKKGPPYTIANIPFPPNSVEAQTGIFGTVGVGKTNAIKEMLGTVRAQNGRAVVYDKMGALVRDFYDPETDIIINPFDARSKVWSPFLEARTPEAIAQVAEVMIPQRAGEGDPFWSQTARLVFEYAARSLIKAKTPTNRDLRRAIMTIKAEELEKLVAGTPGQHFFGAHVEKTSASIRANMIASLRFLEFLRDDGEPFSMREWVKSDKPGFIFLTGDAEHSAATRNIISTVIEVAANALMTCEEKRDPSLWFFIDEVPTLNRLPFLVSKLAEIRQFGGAFVLGYQVYSQLEDIYGDKGAQSISGTLNNRVVFNTPDARTAKLFSESLGFEDLVEQRENLSFGAHESRDGVAFISQRVERPIVTASEIQALPQFHAFIRFAYDAPTAKVYFEPITTEARAEKLVPYEGTGFDMDGMDPDKTPAPAEEEASIPAHFAPQLLSEVEAERRAKFVAWPVEQQLAAFEAWRREATEPQFDTNSGRFVAPLADVDVDLMWDHFYRHRAEGQEKPVFRLTPNMDAMIGSRPRKSETGTHIVTVPRYQDVRRLAEQGVQTATVVAFPSGTPAPPDTKPAPDSPPAPAPSDEADTDATDPHAALQRDGGDLV